MWSGEDQRDLQVASLVQYVNVVYLGVSISKPQHYLSVLFPMSLPPIPFPLYPNGQQLVEILPKASKSGACFCLDADASCELHA